MLSTLMRIYNNETPSYRHWDKIEPDSVPVNETYQVSKVNVKNVLTQND